MPTPAEQFSAAIKAIKEAIAAVVTPAAPGAQIVTRFVFDPDGDNWAGLLRSPDDTDANGDQRVHTICIYYDGLDQSDDAPIGSVDPILPLGIVFYHGYELGTDADNSEERLQSEIARVVWALAASTDLGMNEVAEDHPGYASVMGHFGLRVPRLSLRVFGSQPVQYGIGRFEVRMQSRYVRA